MHKQLFVNLPVADLPRSKAFFGQLGFDFNPKFTNDQGACMIIGENIYAMLIARDYFRTFTDKPISDARQGTEVLISLTCDDRAHVDAMVAKAVAAGGTAPRPPQDHGFMYQHGFDDPDGHIWEVFYMDPAVAETGCPGEPIAQPSGD